MPQLHGHPVADQQQAGVTAGQVCSLEKPDEAQQLTATEKAALAFAEKDGHRPPVRQRPSPSCINTSTTSS